MEFRSVEVSKISKGWWEGPRSMELQVLMVRKVNRDRITRNSGSFFWFRRSGDFQVLVLVRFWFGWQLGVLS
jgi:hypothetical protein